MKVLASCFPLHASNFLFLLLPFVLAATSSVTEIRPKVNYVAAADSLLPTFDEGVAREVVRLTEAAYCTGQLVKWNCSVCQSSFPGMRDVTLLQGQARNVRGFVGVDYGTTSTLLDADTARRKQLVAFQGNGDGTGAEEGEGVVLPTGKSTPRIVVTFSGTDPRSIKV